MSEQTKTIKRYTGKQGEEYFQGQLAASLQTTKIKLQYFAPYLDEKAEVLDFGCGSGLLLKELNVSSKVGVEVNPAAVSYARNLGLELYESLGQIKDKRFTHIITSHALEHVPNPHGVLVQMRHLLEPSGKLIWVSPMDDWRANHQKTWKPDDPHMHIYAWTPRSLGNLLVTTGYQPEEIRIIHEAWPPRIGETLWHMNKSLFSIVSFLSATLLRRRQILAVATTTANY